MFRGYRRFFADVRVSGQGVKPHGDQQRYPDHRVRDHGPDQSLCRAAATRRCDGERLREVLPGRQQGGGNARSQLDARAQGLRTERSRRGSVAAKPGEGPTAIVKSKFFVNSVLSLARNVIRRAILFSGHERPATGALSLEIAYSVI